MAAPSMWCPVAQDTRSTPTGRLTCARPSCQYAKSQGWSLFEFRAGPHSKTHTHAGTGSRIRNPKTRLGNKFSSNAKIYYYNRYLSFLMH